MLGVLGALFSCDRAGAQDVAEINAEKKLHWEDFRIIKDTQIDFGVKPPRRRRTGYLEFEQRWGNSPRIGNGHLGARIGCVVGGEKIYFNVVDFWRGKPYNDPRPEAREHLPEIRKALNERQWQKAQDIAYKYFVAKEGVIKPSLGAGWLDLKLDHGKEYSNYRRTLDLDKAEVTATYVVDGVRYDYQAFCSHPDRVMAYRISASRPGTLTLSVTLKGHTSHRVTASGTNELVLAATAGKGGGMRLNCRLRAVAEGGKTTVEGGTISVKRADSVLLLLTGASSYNGSFRDPEIAGKDEAAIAARQMTAAAGRSWEQLLERHRKDYRALFRRFYLELGPRHEAKIGSVQQGCKAGQPHALITQLCRYTLIAGSRKDTPTPMTLQGMWGCTETGRWSNAYHLNENTQKNYHSAEALALPELQEPLFRLIRRISKRGTEIAKLNYGITGWCAHHQTDIWGAAGIRAARPMYATWPFGGAFLAQYLWRHYRYSRDKEFLKEYYPIINGNAEFCLGWLSENKDGWLVSAPSTSPENVYQVEPRGKKFEVTYASTCDMTLIRQALKECLWASEELGVESGLCKRIRKALPKLFPYPIGSEGQLLEWPEEFHLIRSNHRHASGLFGLWSGSEITMQHTPKLFEAAKIAAAFKGSKDRFPGMAVVWARARDGERAVKMLGAPSYPEYWPATIFANGVAQILLQSHAGEIDVLPALPKLWGEGRVYGIRAEGGFTLRFSWKGGKIKTLSIFSARGELAQVRCKGILTTVRCDGRRITARSVSNDVIRFETEKGKWYVLTVRQK